MAKKFAKKYTEVLKKIDQEAAYSIKDAAKLAVETATTKFDSSVEIHMNLNIDVKQADQMVRGTLVLPNGTGKEIKIAAFVEADQVKAAKDAGATLAGLEELIEEVKKGNINFDIAIAQPQVMRDLGKIAKHLGTKGLMPNPKAGTVTPNIVDAIKEIKKGKVEYKADKTGIIHGMVGKVSFGIDKVEENIQTYIDAVMNAKPSGLKGNYVQSIFVTTSMGPSIRIEL